MDRCPDTLEVPIWQKCHEEFPRNEVKYRHLGNPSSKQFHPCSTKSLAHISSEQAYKEKQEAATKHKIHRLKSFGEKGKWKTMFKI